MLVKIKKRIEELKGIANMTRPTTTGHGEQEFLNGQSRLAKSELAFLKGLAAEIKLEIRVNNDIAKRPDGYSPEWILCDAEWVAWLRGAQ